MRLPTDRISNISASGIRKVFEKARSLEKLGKKIIHMEIGRPNFDTPLPIKEVAIKALQTGMVHYTSNYGIDELREAIANKLTEENQVETKSSEVIVTTGAIEGLAIAMLGLLDIGDEVLIPNPYFPSYSNQVKLSGAAPIFIPLRSENRFKIDIDDLKKAVTKKTKMILINTPHNPTGAVYDYDDLEAVADFAKEYDLLVISDECYEKIIYDKQHISIASLPNMKERTIIVNSTSKSYSMTGWRVGFVSSSEQIIDSMIKVHQDLTTCSCSFAQAGTVFAYNSRDTYINEMVKDFRLRRNIVMQHLDMVPDKIDYIEPYGGFYVFPNIEKTGMSSNKFCDYILNEAGVALVSGSAFGDYGEGFIRLAYSCSKEDLEDGMRRLVKAIKAI